MPYWQGGASAEQILASTALQGRRGRNCAAGSVGGGAGGGDGDGRGDDGSGRPISQITSDRSRRREGVGLGEEAGDGRAGDSAAGGEDAELREGEQQQEEKEEEEEEEDSVDDGNREIIDLTAMDVVLTQEREERAAVSFIYDGVGD